MKKYGKILIIAMIVILFATYSSTVLAAVSGVADPSTLTGQDVAGTDKITSLGNQLITILTTVGIVASVIVLIVLGIKYMMGSAEEKAEYKKTMMPYIVGAGLVFAASAIASMFYNFMSNVSA